MYRGSGRRKCFPFLSYHPFPLLIFTNALLQCTISNTDSYSVTVSVTVGADFGLNFNDIVHAGVSASVSVSKGTTTSITTSQICPKGCTCGLQATPELYHVEGDQLYYAHNLGGPDSQCVGGEGVNGPYAIDLPVTIPGAPPDNQAVITYAACRVAHTFCFAEKNMPLCPD